jgi:enamine deaminase RidA (YjgF/YER057c/UK114 family)
VPGLPRTRDWGYAQVVVAGELVFVAGQAGQDEHGNLVSLEFAAQARRTFENIGRALASVGATLADLVSTTTFITDWRYGPEFTAVRSEILGENLTTSALIGVGQLALPGMLLEVQSVAVRGGG